MNDGSQDDFHSVVNDYFSIKCDNEINSFIYKNYFVTVINQNNVGVSDSRNRGLDIAKGEYCLFIDPDDYIL